MVKEEEEERVESAPDRSHVRSAVRDAWDCVVVVRCRVIRGPLLFPFPQGSHHVGYPRIRLLTFSSSLYTFCFITGKRITVGMWFGEICCCCCLAVLPGCTWILQGAPPLPIADADVIHGNS